MWLLEVEAARWQHCLDNNGITDCGCRMVNSDRPIVIFKIIARSVSENKNIKHKGWKNYILLLVKLSFDFLI